MRSPSHSFRPKPNRGMLPGHRPPPHAARRFRRLRCRAGAVCLAVLVVCVTVAALMAVGSWYPYSILHEHPPAKPFLVDGSRSSFTVVIMSQPRRMESLRITVAHYSKCPSGKSLRGRKEGM